ncbi:MAG: sugar kinase [Thermoplasmata archaeon]|nr:MAG: sugar kinase [Thermoplasmata archaeon]
MKWGLVCKPSKKSFAVGEKVYELVGDMLAEHKVAEHLGIKGYSIEEVGKGADAIIVVGGDGTILMTLQHTTKPIFPINTGRIGFLAEIEPKHASDALQQILRGDYQVEDRMKLEARTDADRLPSAANEIVIHASQVGKILPIKLYVDGILTQSFYGDGLIVATPMGSTSYALAVGGPVVDPTLNVFVIAPIAPFRHIATSRVISSDKTLRIKVEKAAQIVIDGMHVHDLGPRQCVEIEESGEKARFIKVNDNFYHKVYKKLSFDYPKKL